MTFKAWETGEYGEAVTPTEIRQGYMRAVAWDAGQEAMREMAASVRLEGEYTPEEYAVLKRMADAIRELPIE